ncbi:agmatinase [Candidatus Daviesbacteria bacterium]|nr:agmatinase [Candidatus Daviesbacteria bacterium]
MVKNILPPKPSRRNFIINEVDTPTKYAEWDQAKFVIIPVPYDGTASYRAGAREAPRAILDASEYIEPYDYELKKNSYQAGIYTRADVMVSLLPGKMHDNIYLAVEEVVDADKVPVILGGEHSITYPAVKAVHKKYPNLTVLYFDAHGDLRQTWEDSPLSHACSAKRIHDLGCRIVEVGIRSISEDEHKLIDKARDIDVIWSSEVHENLELAIKKITKLLPKPASPIYLSFDLDCFDPAYMPATGTPEPGGLTWHQVMSILKTVLPRYNIVGFDAMELSPIIGGTLHYPAATAAKLVYKIIGLTSKI